MYLSNTTLFDGRGMYRIYYYVVYSIHIYRICYIVVYSIDI